MKLNARGFTLIEAMLSVWIVGVLCALLAPALSSVRQEARRTQCLINLRTLHTAHTAYVLAYNRIPAVVPYDNVTDGRTDLAVALGEFLDGAQPSYDADRAVVRTFQPWKCPADDHNAPVKGSSYRYIPADFLYQSDDDRLEPPPPALMGRVVSMLETTPDTPVFYDLDWPSGEVGPHPGNPYTPRSLWPHGLWNVAYADGSVDWAFRRWTGDSPVR